MFGQRAFFVGKPKDYRWRPREKNALAVPQQSAPSAAVMTATANAINALGLDDVPQEFERGEYFVDQTISPSGGSADTALGVKSVSYNDTTIKTTAGVPLSNFQECFDRATGSTGLAGKPAVANLPAGTEVRALMDYTNTERSVFSGRITLDGADKDGLALCACCNRHGQASVGALGSVFDLMVLKNYKIGWFGTPRYNDVNTFLAPFFVNCKFAGVRFDRSDGSIPILTGGNQLDGCCIGVLSISLGSGARCYIYGGEFEAERIYVIGVNQADYAFDCQKGLLQFREFYAEGQMAAPIWSRAEFDVVGVCKYGGGATTTFGKKCFIYDDSVSGGGRIVMHQTSGDSADIVSAVLLKAGANRKRVYQVHQSYAREGAAKMPFAVEAGTGALSALDKLKSLSPDGEERWTMSGTSAAPVLTPTALW
jgi:hypothetical protein